MAKYRHTDVAAGQGLFLTVNLKEQLLPGSFEYMLDDIISTKIDLSVFDRKYKNDRTGASAVPPEALLKLIIYGYSKGQNSSRDIWELGRNNIMAKALTGDMSMHWTTIADFISGNSKEFGEIFTKVLLYCNELELIGGETFAIDGLRLPSNASIEKSGTKAQMERLVQRYRRMAEKHVARHKRKDLRGEADEGTEEKYEKRQKHLERQIQKVSRFLEGMKEKEGKEGQEIQSNVTDNESAMIHSAKGIVQGYIGIAVSDRKNQIIIGAQAVGSANEGGHLPGILDKSIQNMKEAGGEKAWEGKKTVLGDPNYFSEENLRACKERGIEAVIPDSQEKRSMGVDGEKRYDADDFKYHEEGNYYECPYGKELVYKGTTKMRGKEVKVYQGSLKDCRVCPYISKCRWSKKERGKVKQGRKLMISESNGPGSLCRQMREKLKSEEYQEIYAYRIQIIEPVFANIGYCKGLKRFTLRGKEKVNGQWQLYCIVHNLGKCLRGYNAGKWSA